MTRRLVGLARDSHPYRNDRRSSIRSLRRLWRRHTTRTVMSVHVWRHGSTIEPILCRGSRPSPTDQYLAGDHRQSSEFVGTRLTVSIAMRPGHARRAAAADEAHSMLERHRDAVRTGEHVRWVRAFRGSFKTRNAWPNFFYNGDCSAGHGLSGTVLGTSSRSLPEELWTKPRVARKPEVYICIQKRFRG